MPSLVNYLDRICCILVYFVSSLGCISIIKVLNYRFCFAKWMLLAMVSRLTWVLAMPLHSVLQAQEGIHIGATWKQLRCYSAVAVGLTAMELLSAVSISVLPGSVYALIKGSEIGWSMALSAVVLKKEYAMQQILAAACVMGGVILVLVLGVPPPSREHEHAAAVASRAIGVDRVWASVLCMAAAFGNALTTVCTESILKDTLKEEEDKVIASQNGSDPPSKLLLVNAYSMWTSFFSFCFLSCIAALGGDFSRPPEIDASCDGSTYRAAEWVDWAVFVMCIALVSTTKFFERVGKHWICVRDSAMTFSIVQAARRIVAVFMLSLAFGERLTASMIAGATCSAVGFLLHWHAGNSRDKGADGGKHSSPRTLQRHCCGYELVDVASKPNEPSLVTRPVTELLEARLG